MAIIQEPVVCRVSGVPVYRNIAAIWACFCPSVSAFSTTSSPQRKRGADKRLAQGKYTAAFMQPVSGAKDRNREHKDRKTAVNIQIQYIYIGSLGLIGD